jgi:hypothetical protein
MEGHAIQISTEHHEQWPLDSGSTTRKVSSGILGITKGKRAMNTLEGQANI